MIDANKILQSNLIDLLFDGRNKNYGAYELRTNYRKRMSIAVTIMLVVCLLFFLLFAYGSRPRHNNGGIVVKDDSLINVIPPDKIPEVTPPPPPKPKVPEVKIRQFTTPRITDEPVKPDEKPPEQNELETAKIGKINQEGADDIGTAPPIQDQNRGIIETPKKADQDDDGIVLKVEIESEYPGGIEAWRHFLGKNLRYPSAAQENEIEGTVIVQFIVDKAGAVSDVEAVSGPTELRDEAVRVIKKSGNWKPAIQNGRQVKSYKKQPITFLLDKG